MFKKHPRIIYILLTLFLLIGCGVKEKPLEVVSGESYTSKEEVALYIHLYEQLPPNFVTKEEAREAGWLSEKGNLAQVLPGKSIGGDRFGNYEKLLPDKKGRIWFECDINYQSGFRGSERIVFSNDGIIAYTKDHYRTFEILYDIEGSK